MIEKNYISQKGTAKQDKINELINSNIENSNMVLMYTYKFECSLQSKITDTEHLLEARIFTKKKELKIIRPTIADEFSYRIIDDDSGQYNFIEEKHYLDIDKTRSEGVNYITTGGGKYSLSIENAEKVLVRNYISYDEQGIAQITDFRIVEYLCKEAK